jgi:hypothetical protein
MNIRFSKYLFMVTILGMALRASAMPIWPVRPNDANFNIIHCVFGEIHGTGQNHFHQGIDIGVANGIHPKSIENGVVINEPTGDTIEIGYGTPINNVYPRKIIIHEFTPNPNLHRVNPVAAGETELGTISQRHLHFEMWYSDGNTLYAVNPLNNDVGWELPYQQYVSDRANPEVNNIFLELIHEPANVASGYLILQPRSGAITDAANNTAVKVHIEDRPGSILPRYNPDVDKLVVFGSVGPIANVRDADVDGGSNGDALTVQAASYTVDERTKYLIEFDRVAEAEKYVVTNIFHTEFNNGDEIFGNNDFIELRSDGRYLYPHKLQSNGVWFTKARNTTPSVFLQTPAETAGVSEDALYPDGEHTLIFHVEDAAGRIDRAPGKAEDNAKVKVIVDNFRPYVKDVNINSGEFPIYSSAWSWQAPNLKLLPNQIAKKADRGQPLHMTVTTSEPMQLTTDAQGRPQGSVNIRLFARDPQNPSHIKVSQDWYDPAHPEQNPSSKSTGV